MKTKIWAAAGVALFVAGVYLIQKWRVSKVVEEVAPERENERHHLTNVFSKAKEVAMGN